MKTETRKNETAHRYELLLGGELVGIADFHVAGDAVVFPHTEIEATRRGQGLGEILVRAALDDVRASGRRVVPQCWYVAQFIDGHPQYRDLLAA